MGIQFAIHHQFGIHYATLSSLWVVVRHKRNHIGNITVQSFANLDKGRHGDMLSLTHVGDMVRCQMRLEPQIFLAHVLVNQCFPQRLVADFHDHFSPFQARAGSNGPGAMAYLPLYRPY